MSLLRGEPGSVWALPKAVDALVESARQTSRPGLIWLAGLGYQYLNLGWMFGASVVFPVVQEALPRMPEDYGVIAIKRYHELDLLAQIRTHGLPLAIALAPIVLVLFRIVAGLARISPAADWEEARGGRRQVTLRAAWRRGRRLALPTIGLWIQLVLMMFGATLIFIGPAQLLVGLLDWDGSNLLVTILSGVVVGLLLVYSFLLSILFQIALHSLVQNRRGVGSALLHAWRIAKNDPGATTRATLVDAVLYFTIIVIVVAVVLTRSLLGLHPMVAIPLVLLVEAFAGCTRCAYWARAYQALGGLSTVDDVPGN